METSYITVDSASNKRFTDICSIICSIYILPYSRDQCLLSYSILVSIYVVHNLAMLTDVLLPQQNLMNPFVLHCFSELGIS